MGPPVRPGKPRPIAYVIGPTGDILTKEDLPPANTKRWVIRRKAEVVVAVRGGLLSLDDACKRYRLTIEEFAAWQRAVETLPRRPHRGR
jgi:Protein of unknown function (DUF1153)